MLANLTIEPDHAWPGPSPFENCDAVNIALLVAKIVAFASTGSKAVLASLADSAGMF